MKKKIIKAPVGYSNYNPMWYKFKLRHVQIILNARQFQITARVLRAGAKQITAWGADRLEQRRPFTKKEGHPQRSSRLMMLASDHT
jgi:hypothetical protein